MKSDLFQALPTLGAALFLLASCVPDPGIRYGADGKPMDADGNHVNPFEPGTYEHFTARQDYPKTMDVWRNEAVLSRTTPAKARLVVSRSKQRAFLMTGHEVAIDYPISSGSPSRPTPPGDYTILEKIVDKSSNSYGKVYDAEGNRVYGKETPGDVPEGGKFVGAPMPYWMRMTWDGVGHHIGPIPKSRKAVSHACIRGPRSVMPTVFQKTRIGTPVVVE